MIFGRGSEKKFSGIEAGGRSLRFLRQGRAIPEECGGNFVTDVWAHFHNVIKFASRHRPWPILRLHLGNSLKVLGQNRARHDLDPVKGPVGGGDPAEAAAGLNA